jgi:Protein of unknown function (DUF2480)
MQEEVIVNRVASSSLITLDLEDLVPKKPIQILDIAPMLFQGLLLREKDFRESVKQLDTSPFSNNHVGLVCSTDAIIPSWAFMLLTLKLQTVALSVWLGDAKEVRKQIVLAAIAAIEKSDYQDAKVVVKGCSEEALPPEAYVAITAHLGPVVSSLM